MRRSVSFIALALCGTLGLLAPAGAAFAQAGATTQPTEAPAATGKAGKHGRVKADKTIDIDTKLINEATAELELTADQKGKITAIMSEFAKSRRAWAAEHEAELAQLRSKARAAQESKDRASGRTAMEQIRTLESSGPQFKVAMLKVRDVLSPEQQARFDVKLLERTGSAKPAKNSERTGKPEKPSRHGKS